MRHFGAWLSRLAHRAFFSLLRSRMSLLWELPGKFHIRLPAILLEPQLMRKNCVFARL
jgi:hypothetical protein